MRKEIKTTAAITQRKNEEQKGLVLEQVSKFDMFDKHIKSEPPAPDNKHKIPFNYENISPKGKEDLILVKLMGNNILSR